MNGLDMAAVLPVVAQTPTDRIAALFDAHHARLYRLARRLVPTADDARDLVQEAFLKAARSPGSVPSGHSDEEAWLMRILVNIRRDQWRKAAVRKRYDDDVRRAPVEETDEEGALIAHATIWRALDVLAPRRRAVLVMHELEGLSAKDIGSLLGISAVTARWHLLRGRRELARILNR
jgi:RNA polymerase sigma-70 factor (ECF subfamily)